MSRRLDGYPPVWRARIPPRVPAICKHSVTEIDDACQTGIPARVTNLSPVLLYAVSATFSTAFFLLGSVENLDAWFSFSCDISKLTEVRLFIVKLIYSFMS